MLPRTLLPGVATLLRELYETGVPNPNELRPVGGRAEADRRPAVDLNPPLDCRDVIGVLNTLVVVVVFPPLPLMLLIGTVAVASWFAA